MNQIGNVIAYRLKRRLLVGCLTTLIGVPCMGACFLILFTVIFPVLDGNTPAENSILLPVLGITAVGFLMAVPLVIAIVTIIRRARMMDAVLSPYGLTGSMFMIYGRQYHGMYHGRMLDVYLFRGPTIELHMETPLQTRFQVFPQNSVPATTARMFNKPALKLDIPMLADYSVYAVDEGWTGRLLHLQPVSHAVIQLMARGADWVIFRRMELQPGEIVLNLYRSRNWLSMPLVQEEISVWLDAMESMLQSAEVEPAPQINAAPDTNNREARQRTSTVLTRTVIAILILLPLCLVAVGVGVYIFTILMG